MSNDGSVKQRGESETSNALVCTRAKSLSYSNSKEPRDQPESSEEFKFHPFLYSCLQERLPASNLSRASKVKFMNDLLSRYYNEAEKDTDRRNIEYRQKIMSAYKPLHKELHTPRPDELFIPSFYEAIKENTEASLKSIISEISPGLYTFNMLQPAFCEMMMDEVCNIEKWIEEEKHQVMRPSTMHKFGFVLDDFGFGRMLDQLMGSVIRPMSKVLFPEVGGYKIDSHHAFIVQYGKHRETNVGFHVDSAEVTLNVCLGDEFEGGLLHFEGVRCEKHQNVDTEPEVEYKYTHKPGRALLHRGRHRHFATGTTSGYRLNLVIWCRSSAFQEMVKLKKEFPEWCGECSREKERKQQELIADLRQSIRSGVREN